MTRRCLFAGLLLCLSVSFAMARNGVVKTKDGRSIEGDIADNGPDGVTITIKGGTVSFARADVEDVTYAASIDEQYNQRLAALPKDAPASAHFDLARWLYDAKAYALSRKELDTALTIDPNYADAVTLKQTVDRAMAWERGGPRPATAVTGTPTSRPSVIASGKERHVLDQEQINTIRLAELKDTDRVRVRFDNNVVNRYIDYERLDRREFTALPDFAKAVAILRQGNSAMRKDVAIISDPPAMMEFKQRVQPALLSGCSTANCHGGTNGGRLVLLNPADNDGATYTNFYILTQFTTTTTKANEPGATVTRKAIDRLYPDTSLILQYGLARDMAEFPHPEALNWASAYRGKDDPRYRGVFEWIRGSLLTVEPKYGIDFPLPGAPSPATQPAGAQAPEKATAPAQPPVAPPQARQTPSTPPPAPPQNDRRPESGQYPNELKDVRDRVRTIRGL